MENFLLLTIQHKSCSKFWKDSLQAIADNALLELVSRYYLEHALLSNLSAAGNLVVSKIGA